MLNILEGYPLKDLGFRSAQAVHYQIEAMRHAYVDRNSYLGDPDFVKNPLDRLLDKGYAEQDPRGHRPDARPASRKDIKPGVAPHEGSNTTHYSIVDQWGNAVSVTYTLNDWFGAKVTAAGTGVLLNNEMDDFTSKIGVPNLYGLVQGEANAIAPGKRPLSSMSPTIVSQGRQAGDRGRHARRQPHHHGGAAHHPQRRRLRHERAGGGRRAALPPAVAARRDQRRDLRAQPRHPQAADRHGPQPRACRSRPTTWRRSSSARRRWAASRWATTASTAPTIRAATPGWRSATDAASTEILYSQGFGTRRVCAGLVQQGYRDGRTACAVQDAGSRVSTPTACASRVQGIDVGLPREGLPDAAQAGRHRVLAEALDLSEHLHAAAVAAAPAAATRARCRACRPSAGSTRTPPACCC